MLNTSCVVIANILLEHLNKVVLAGEPSAIIAFPFQNTPEALHRTVLNAMRHTGHILRHLRLHGLVVKCAVGVLESSVVWRNRESASGLACAALSKVLKPCRLSLRSLST